MEFKFFAKKHIDDATKADIEMDIDRANIENMRVYNRIHSRCNKHGIGWAVRKIPILNSLPDEALYFKDNLLFEYVAYGSKNAIIISVNDVAVAKMEQAALLKPSELSKAKSFFLEKFGFEAPKTMDSKDKLRSELIKALKHNGVEVNG